MTNFIKLVTWESSKADVLKYLDKYLDAMLLSDDPFCDSYEPDDLFDNVGSKDIGQTAKPDIATRINNIRKLAHALLEHEKFEFKSDFNRRILINGLLEHGHDKKLFLDWINSCNFSEESKKMVNDILANVVLEEVDPALTNLKEAYRRTVSIGNRLADNELFVDFD